MTALRTAMLAIGLLFAMAHAATAADAACSQPDIEQAAQQVLDARHAMKALPVPGNFETGVSAETQRAVAALKMRLGDLTNAYMRCAPEQADAKQVEHDLVGLARGTDPDPTDDAGYGDRVDFDVRLTNGPPRLASIVAKFAIHCGEDAALFVFSRQADAWQEALRWHSKDYPTVGGAFWSFDYAISPPDRTGGWFVVTKNVAPWCSSVWSEIRYSVLRPNPAGSAPALLLNASDTIWWGGDDFGTLSVGASGFTIRYHGSSGNPVKLTRQYARRFRVAGKRVEALGR